MMVDLAHGRASGINAILGIENVISGSGNDTLTGGEGANGLAGGAGDDTYITDGSDTLSESANAGLDTVHSTVTFTLANNFENLTLTGAGNVNGTGNGANNVITGNDGHNRLLGGAGLDTLAGGKGEDVLLGGGGKDIMARGDGNDPSSSMPSTTPASAPPTAISSPTSRAAGGDTIDLSALDANALVGGNQAFVFIGTAGFSAAGQLRYQQVGGETVIQANTNNATGTIEFELRVFGSHALIADDLFSSVNSLVSANGRRQATWLPEVGARRTAHIRGGNVCSNCPTP
jgi:Ca2+-binding RTX toxin-like protein